MCLNVIACIDQCLFIVKCNYVDLSIDRDVKDVHLSLNTIYVSISIYIAKSDAYSLIL